MKILSFLPALAWLIISALFFAYGEYLSKYWALQPRIWVMILAAITSALSMLAWLPALLYKNQLAVIGTLWAVLATIATVSIGVLIFAEKLTVLQWIGAGFALIAMALLAS